MVTRVSYEADVLPRNASPPWDTSRVGTPIESVSDGILTMECSGIESWLYLRRENPFTHGVIWFRLRREAWVTGSHSFLLGFGTTASPQIRIRRGTPQENLLKFDVPGATDTIELDLSEWHDFRLQYLKVAKGYPKAHLFIDDALESTLTGTSAITPRQVRITFNNTAGTNTFYLDYLRYKLGRATDRRQRLVKV